MLKTELIKLLENVADDGDINETLLGSDEFKGFKDLSKLGIEDIKEILTGEVGKVYMTSHDDSVRSIAVETYKNGKGKDAIEKARREGIEEGKNGKKKTPEIEMIEELQAQLNSMKAEKEQAEKLNSNTQLLKEKNMPIELAKYINDENDITTFENIISTAVQKAIDEKLGTHKETPPTGGTPIKKMSLAEIMAYANEHPGVNIQELIEQNK